MQKNRLAEDGQLLCPNCHAPNLPSAEFCSACGAAMEMSAIDTVSDDAEAFEPFKEIGLNPKDSHSVQKNSNVRRKQGEYSESDEAFASLDSAASLDNREPAAAFASLEVHPQEEVKPETPKISAQQLFAEEQSIFADGLPEWTVLPPNSAVRRRRR